MTPMSWFAAGRRRQSAASVSPALRRRARCLPGSTTTRRGHRVHGTGSVEALFVILAIRDGVVPPTLNLDNPSPSCDIDLVPKRAKERRVNYALSNSFGFGGTNASLIFVGPP